MFCAEARLDIFDEYMKSIVSVSFAKTIILLITTKDLFIDLSGYRLLFNMKKSCPVFLLTKIFLVW